MVADHLDVPKACRVEILAGAVVISPPQPKKHGGAVRRLHAQSLGQLPQDRCAVQVCSVGVPEGEDYATPDLMVVRSTALDDDGWLVRPDDVDCVVEVVSPGNAANDTKIKPSLYARWRIPLYLIIDPRSATTRLYWDPKDGEYQARHDAEFGTDVVLPEPLKDVRIDTSVFPRYGG
ncbi:Uma2 family endonuclease [Nocardiopsis sp. NPDC049922]|uniref:Uma2 family endonuclease n=1 Tax=Nocardiopsis sp. NPDC049922 TaxID=3155157 RepID=UPI0033EF0459